MQSSSCYIEYSSHFFWNVNFLTDISDVEKSKICPRFENEGSICLPHTQFHLMDLFLQTFFSFSYVVMHSKKLMTICCANRALINISPSYLSSRTKLPHHTLPLALNLGNILTHYGGFPSAVVISACNMLM